MTMSLPTIAEPDVLTRSVADVEYDIDRARGVVEAIIVPYLTPTDVIEVRESPRGPFVLEYREQFVPPALDRARSAPRRVGLTFTHSMAMPDRMGYGVELRDSASEGAGNGAAIMAWQLYRDTLDRSVELLTTTHTGMSLSFRTIRPQYGTEQPGQLVTREAVHLITVAATDDPAYVDTRVLSIRERAAELDREREANEARAAQYVEGLLLLRQYGRELTPAQTAYLTEHGHPAPTA
jgi:phage head maturation protease